jgi:hypothetical protein
MLPVPDGISQLSNRTKQHMMPDQLLATKLGDIIIRLANFRASMASKGRFNSGYSVPVLLKLDSDLETWAFNLPSSWRYELHIRNPRGDLYTPYYHKYPGFSIATVWNQYRIARCIVNDILLTYLDSSLSENSALTQIECGDQIKETILNVCTDICASVPYFLCQMDENDPPKPGVGALEVMWALFNCASTQCLPDEQRCWAIKQLYNIGHGMGIPQALKLADLKNSEIMLGK